MAITFSNTIFGPGKWGVIYLFRNQGTVDYVSPDRIVLNGTVVGAGDKVSVIYNDATYQFTVTALGAEDKPLAVGSAKAAFSAKFVILQGLLKSP